MARPIAPTREEAVRNELFTESNDFNPLVQTDCTECRGTPSQVIGCPTCGGTGVAKEPVPYFETIQNPARIAHFSVTSGTATCAGCGTRFMPYDKHVWTGAGRWSNGDDFRSWLSRQREHHGPSEGRHRCGQRLTILFESEFRQKTLDPAPKPPHVTNALPPKPPVVSDVATPKSTPITHVGPMSNASKFPCEHERVAGDLVDADFDVICPVCYGHFFRYAFLPYLVFVASFATVYFWRPLGLANMLFITLSLFVASYLSAILRRRPDRLFLVLLVLSSVMSLVLVRPSIGTVIAAPLDRLTFASLGVLAITIAIGLGQGIKRMLGEGVHDASPLLSLVFVGSLVITVADLALKSASALVPSLDGQATYLATSTIIDLIQRYKSAAILIAVAIAVVWTGGQSVSTARERVEEHPWQRTLRHEWWEELLRILFFFALVLVEFFLGVWTLFRDTLAHLWRAASTCARVFLLIIAAWALSTVLRELAGLIAGIWERNTFWLDTWVAAWLIPSDVLLAWVATWAVILIASVGDRRNSVVGWREELLHAVLLTRFNLVRSTPVYWFYLSFVLFVSWFVISALRLAKDPGTELQIGIVFVTYLGLILVLGAANVTRGALRVSNRHG